MKRLEVKLYIDIDENQTTSEDVIFHLDSAVDDIIGGVVKRVDLIDEIQLAEVQ